MAQHETLMSWLNDAYAMENALVSTLEGHAKDAQGMPAMQQRIEQHIAETKRHADLVRQCIEGLGGSTSGLKTGMAKLTGATQGMGTSIMAGGDKHDNLVKNGLADFAAEEFEVASYKALMVAAQAAGATEVARVADTIMREDMAMAQWLDQHLPMVVQETMMAHATT